MFVFENNNTTTADEEADDVHALFVRCMTIVFMQTNS